MIKKIISIVVLILIFLSFTSCSKESTNDEFDIEGAYNPTENLNISVWETYGNDFNPQKIENNIVEDWLVEKTKVKVTQAYGNGGGDWGDKLSMLIVGDNLPHIISCSGGQGPVHFAKLDSMGKIWQLDKEMIKKYAPNVWERTPEELWDKLTINGKLLGIPSGISWREENSRNVSLGVTDEEHEMLLRILSIPGNVHMAQSSGYLYIRDDILKDFFPETKSFDELSDLLKKEGKPIGDALMDVPIYSTEDFIDFMYNISKAGYTEQGKKVYAYGYYGSDLWAALTWLGADMYGYKGHSYTSTWNSEKKKIEIPIVGEMIKRAASTQNQMINDGVIDPESVFHTDEQFEEKILNGQYAIASIHTIDSITEINKRLEESGVKFRYRPFITQVPPQKGYENFKTSTSNGWNRSICFSKTLTEEQLFQILNWINVQYSDEYEQIVNWGPPEAELYVETENGRRYKDSRFEKYFVDGDTSALSDEETMGLRGPRINIYEIGGLFGVLPRTAQGRWYPPVVYKREVYTTEFYSGFKLAEGSAYSKGFKHNPPCNIWNSNFSNIDEVIVYWSERERWEEKFKLALVAENDKFDEAWQGAVDYLNSIIDIDKMAEKMTEAVSDYIVD